MSLFVKTENDYNKDVIMKGGEQMKYLILVSHGGFAAGLKTSLAMFAGDKIEQVIAVGLKNDETVARFSDDVREALKFLKPEDSVVVLADIVGGSPLTTLCSVLDEMGKLDDAIILGGMNLPMAITTAVMKDSLEKDALVQAVLPEAKAAVQQFSAAETEDEDDDEI